MSKPPVFFALGVMILALRVQLSSDEPRVHLDHVPIAVRDLPAAVEQFRSMGFTIKPGRPHDGGIENASIKFADGSYIELITAHDARDSLAREYDDLLKAQEGAAYVFVRDPGGSFSERVQRAGGRRETSGTFAFTEFPARWHAPHLQLIEYLAPAHESPPTYQHSNGARRLVAVWMVVDRADDPVARELGAVRRKVRDFAFEHRVADAVGLADGTCLMLTPRRAQDAARSVALAILVEVDSLTAVTRIEGVSRFQSRGSASWLPPADVHGIWLGFVERAKWLTETCAG